MVNNINTNNDGGTKMYIVYTPKLVQVEYLYS